MAKKENKANAEVQTETTDTVSKEQRVRRLSMQSILPTDTDSFGKVIVTVIGADQPIEYSKDLSGIDKFIAAGFLAGVSERLAIVVSGLKDTASIIAKLVAEIAVLDTGVYTTRAGTGSKQVPDILLAWASLYDEDMTKSEVVAKYQKAWDDRDEEGKKQIRTNLKVQYALDTIRANRKKEAGAEVEIPAL